MNADRATTYRLELAKKHLNLAEEDLELKRWVSAASNAQLGLENAAKAIVACFGLVPRSHDVAEHLEGISMNELPPELAGEVQTIIPIVAKYGLKKHILVTYGDEKAYLTPWELFGEEEATGEVEDARRCVALAEGVYKHFFKNPCR